MRGRRWPYLVIAAVLLGLGAWLTSGGEAPKVSARPQVKMPRGPDAEDRGRAQARRAAAPPPVVPTPLAPEAARPRPSDPVLAALPADVKEVAVVVEANALRNSDLGDAMVACFTAGAPQALGVARDAGFDPLSQLDRISLFDDTLMMTGDFRGLHFGSVGDERYGEATLHRTQRRGKDTVFAVWKDQATLVGSEEEVKRAIDRLEGRAGQAERPVLDEDSAYGELYGVLKPEALANVFDDIDPGLSSFIRGAAESVSLHVNAMHDVGVVAEVKGVDPAKVDELRRMMGGTIAAARARAAAEGKTNEADVLDLSRVLAPAPGGKSFSLELGLPYEMLKAQLDKCVEEGRRRAGSPLDAGT